MNREQQIHGKPLNPMLRMAALAGVDAVVKLHIRRGDDINARDGSGMTPLMLAAFDKASVCSLLIEAGADTSLADPAGRDAFPLHWGQEEQLRPKFYNDTSSTPEAAGTVAPEELIEKPSWIATVLLDDDWEAGALPTGRSWRICLLQRATLL